MNRSDNIFAPDLVLCSIQYAIITCILTAVRFEIWMMVILYQTQNEIKGLLLYVVIEIINIQILSSFIYMILHDKMKFKRFFSFMHFKYFKFNFLTAVTFALFFGGGTFALNSSRFTGYSMYLEKRWMFYMLALLWLALSSFKLVFAYFRAMSPDESFKNITKEFFDFAVKNIKPLTLFNIKMIPWIIGYILFIIIFNSTDYDIVVYVMLNSCLYGLGILFYPYYILDFHKLICYLQNDPEI